MLLTHESAIPEFDALLVLGRGIELDGTLSPHSEARAEAAAWVSQVILPRVVVFSGGRSRVQVAAGEMPPAEGEGMLRHALGVLGDERPESVEYLAENESTSTVANMVNSAPLLQLRPGDRLAIMSDNRHFGEGRPQLLGSLVYPGRRKFALRLPDATPPTAGELAEERFVAFATRIVMAGVQYGNHDAILRRHKPLDLLSVVSAGRAQLMAKAA